MGAATAAAREEVDAADAVVVGIRHERECAGGSVDLCCGSCVTADSESQTETQLLGYSVLNARAALALTATVRVMKRRKAALDGLSDAAM